MKKMVSVFLLVLILMAGNATAFTENLGVPSRPQSDIISWEMSTYYYSHPDMDGEGNAFANILLHYQAGRSLLEIYGKSVEPFIIENECRVDCSLNDYQDFILQNTDYSDTIARNGFTTDMCLANLRYTVYNCWI